MKYTLILVLFLCSFLLIPVSNAQTCPAANNTDRYVITKLHAENQGEAAGEIRIYYKLLNEYNREKPTLLVINGGPGGDHSIIDIFRNTELAEKMNIVSFDHRGLGCTYPL